MSNLTAASSAPPAPNMIPQSGNAANEQASSFAQSEWSVGTPTTTYPASLEPLIAHLGSEAHMLRYLPFKKARFFPHTQENMEIAIRLLYGTMKSNSKHHVFVFFYPAKRLGLSPSLELHEYNVSDEGLTYIDRIGSRDVGKLTNPSEAFHNIVQGEKVISVAKYYFMRKGLPLEIPVTISTTFKRGLRDTWNDLKKIRDTAAAADVADNPRPKIMKTQQQSFPQASRQPFKATSSRRSLTQQLLPSDDEDCGRASPIASAVVKLQASYNPNNRREGSHVQSKQLKKILVQESSRGIAHSTAPKTRGLGTASTRTQTLAATSEPQTQIMPSQTPVGPSQTPAEPPQTPAEPPQTPAGPSKPSDPAPTYGQTIPTHHQTEHTSSKSTPDSLIDRCLELENNKNSRAAIIQGYEKQITTVQQALITERQLQDQEARELKRVYEELSKEQFRELGRREEKRRKEN